jgi:2-dehydro-3-deoxyphosphogluconate aldolase/(4S)-4-hydroxy-2-oxoglutarate aldolase
MKEKFSSELFNKMPVVGIMRHFPEKYIDPVVQCYQKAGFTTLEITMNSLGSAITIRRLTEQWGKRLNIGAGTVCSINDLDDALQAGAQFIVTPVINEKVIEKCIALDVPVFVGAFTPSEIYRAWTLGAHMVKLFPAGTLGPSYIKDILAPLDRIPIMPTGGVTVDNCSDFFKAGAKGVGIGNNLFPMHLIENNKWEELEIFFSDLVSQYNRIKVN